MGFFSVSVVFVSLAVIVVDALIIVIFVFDAEIFLAVSNKNFG